VVCVKSNSTCNLACFGSLVIWLVLVHVIMHSVPNSHWDLVCLVRSELFTAVVIPVIALCTDTSS
jgi:hypothetical protein